MQRARREKCQAYCGHEKRGKPNALTVLVLQLILLGTITHLRVFGGCCKIVESIGVCSASGFIPAGPVWLALLFLGGGGGDVVASDVATDPGWTASSFLFSPSHCQLQLSHWGTIEERRGCSLNGKNKLESAPSHSPPPHDSSSAFDRTPVLLSSPPLFFCFLLFSACALHNPPFSLALSLPAKCSCYSPLDFFFSDWLLIRIAFYWVLSLKLVKLAISTSFSLHFGSTGKEAEKRLSQL